jgi:hypothetical protein
MRAFRAPGAASARSTPAVVRRPSQPPVVFTGKLQQEENVFVQTQIGLEEVLLKELRSERLLGGGQKALRAVPGTARS